ncbi:unnamed protein product [Adineta ricciae]|uniref:CWH43-like N-terminal domain-containing protein n=1 Tax=Adineta ricciae TaxID=249248 RepID=A0A814HVZ7_ADIRI|nr:unnamed protein product [Adineta ricciae]CAF1307591.1 unnamed protein product [Adineta ricciae]
MLSAVSPSWQHLLTRILGILASLIASLAWLATIAALFGLWARDDFVRYEPDDGEVVYISNVGAVHKTAFIIGTSITGTFFFLTLLFTKLCFDMENRRRFKRSMSIISIICSLIGGASLILLSIFDSSNHSGAHYTFTGLFIVFTILSAIFTVFHRFSRYQWNFTVYLRVAFIGLVIPLAITFAVMSSIKGPNNVSTLKSVAASIEWSIAIIFVMYLAAFGLDLLFY